MSHRIIRTYKWGSEGHWWDGRPKETDCCCESSARSAFARCQVLDTVEGMWWNTGVYNRCSDGVSIPQSANRRKRLLRYTGPGFWHNSIKRPERGAVRKASVPVRGRRRRRWSRFLCWPMKRVKHHSNAGPPVLSAADVAILAACVLPDCRTLCCWLLAVVLISALVKSAWRCDCSESSLVRGYRSSGCPADRRFQYIVGVGAFNRQVFRSSFLLVVVVLLKVCRLMEYW